mmetsp:Transcript_130599/g.325881  ORF Transcript_130599/g.325881 Transcript_130599/m.325881 type:complete len:400 (-) Transcript_130599:90-1289(-)
MAFAAAAVVGARRGGNRPGGLKASRALSPPNELESSSGPNVATGIATCACSILICAGATALVNSFSNERVTLVEDYDHRVEEWGSSARQDFGDTWLHVTAHWNMSTASSEHNESIDLQASDAVERSFHDAEHGKGLLSYTPLKFTSTFHFDSYYPADGNWEALPSFDAAQTVVFEVKTRSQNGTTSSFSTRPLPLAYDEVVRARTPAPENKCRREQSGNWRNRQCHVTKRLQSLCIQLYHDEAGAWRPHAKVPSSGSLSAALESDTFGCDPSTGWHPATYVKDTCYGPQQPWKDSCSGHKASDPHLVMVMVRSARDPFLRAEELLGNELNFGLSTWSQRSYGITMLAIGLFLCIVPILRCREHMKSKKRREDARSLRYSRDEDDGPINKDIGVYGNRSL